LVDLSARATPAVAYRRIVAPRGSFQFDTTPDGDLACSPANVECLRRLWLDRSLVNGDSLGPGDPGDFDHGAWHVACHLLAAGGVRQASDGRLLWLEISHDPQADQYYASITVREAASVRTQPLDSVAAQGVLAGSVLLGFVEGNSLGHVSVRGARDTADRFNGWRRQQFDQCADSPEDGGKVWEHWCTTRDIRSSDRIGSSVLRAYVMLSAALGDRFVAAVARGRRDYGHPEQLSALVTAGLTSEVAATWDTEPHALPPVAERLLLEATPQDAMKAVETLSWQAPPRYYMFRRRIERWSDAPMVRALRR
jgi:hypothetical protein